MLLNLQPLKVEDFTNFYRYSFTHTVTIFVTFLSNWTVVNYPTNWQSAKKPRAAHVTALILSFMTAVTLEVSTYIVSSLPYTLHLKSPFFIFLTKASSSFTNQN